MEIKLTPLSVTIQLKGNNGHWRLGHIKVIFEQFVQLLNYPYLAISDMYSPVFTTHHMEDLWVSMERSNIHTNQ